MQAACSENAAYLHYRYLVEIFMKECVKVNKHLVGSIIAVLFVFTVVFAITGNEEDGDVERLFIESDDTEIAEFVYDRVPQEVIEKLEHMDDSELLPIYIWRKNVDYTLVENALKKRGFDDSFYGDEVAFKEYITSVGLEENNEAISNIRIEYKNVRLQAIREVTIEYNHTFLRKHGLQNSESYYLSEYTSTIALALTPSEINRILLDEEVLDISLYEDLIFEPTISVTPALI
jgi:hypothetical protein